MRAEVISLYDFLFTEQQILVPVYQRPYSWEEEDWQRLADDIVYLYKKNLKSYFIGSIVYILGVSPSPPMTRTMIDGQQRLATIIVLITALRDFLKQRNKPHDNQTTTTLQNNFLINDKFEGAKRYKLTLSSYDKEVLENLINAKSEGGDNANRAAEAILICYKFFKEQFENNDLDPDKILDCLKKLKIVAIELRETSENEGEAKEQEENPQDIFESINSTGKDLCEAVLIKNRILANVKNTSEQEYIFSTYCQSISMFLQQKDKRLELFFRHYLIMKTHSHISEDEIYKEFKSYWMENIETNSVTDLCEDILTFAKHYQEITFCDAKDEKLNALYREIAALEHTVCYPFILKLLGDNEKGLLSKEQLYEIIKLCISYMFRLNMCAKMINDLGEIFIDLIEHVCANQCRAVPLDYLICVKEFFAQLNNRKKFPDDKQFQDIFCQKNIYSSKKRCKYILEQLETFENKQAPKVSEMSVEHIVPQNLSKEWIIALDKDVNKIKAQYLHTIGNLTLSAYNSHLSDKLFKEKLNADPGGFKVSGLRINKYIVNQKTWKLKQIQERSKELSDLACKVWPYHNIASGSISATQKFTPSSASLVPSSMPNQILFEAIDERIMQLHKNRIIRDFKNIKNPEFEYIDKKTNIRFAKVCPMKTKVNIFAAISPVKVNDPKRMCKDSKKLPSNYPIRIDMRDIELIDDALEIIKQAL